MIATPHFLCTGCKKWLPVEAFHKNDSAIDKITSQCRACNCAAAKERGRIRREEAERPIVAPLSPALQALVDAARGGR